MGEQMQSRTNHTSDRKFVFNECAANVLDDNIGMTSEVVEAVRGQKTSYLGAHFGTLTQCLVHPSAPLLLTKDSPRNQL